MSGDATFSGTTYQAEVIAYVYAHILAQSRLGWRPLVADAPTAVQGETDGPGDDACIEFNQDVAALEVQAKRGLSGGTAFLDILDKAAGRWDQQSERIPLVITVDRGSSSSRDPFPPA